MLSELADAGPLLVVDGGNALVRSRRPSPAALPQARATAGVVAEGLAAFPLDAMALGEQDWWIGAAHVESLVQAHGLPIVVANLVCDGAPPHPASRIVERGGVRVGIVGVTWGEVDGCVVTDPVAAATQARRDLGTVDLAVLLAPLPEETLDGWTDPPFDLVVDGTEAVQSANGRAWGDGWRVSAGSRGKYLGVVELGFRGGRGWRHADRTGVIDAAIARAEEDLRAARERATGSGNLSARRSAERAAARAEEALAALRQERATAAAAPDDGNVFRVRLVELSDAVEDDPATAAIVARGKAAIADAEEVPEASVATTPRVAPEGSPFAGGDVCASCHAEPHAQWAGTSHARAWSTLQAAGRGFDRRCLSCHVTGWEAPGGPDAPGQVGPFRDVQCEACHGPARDHAADPTVPVVRDPGIERCRTCHDGEQDGGRFDPDGYRVRVVHRPGITPG